MKKIDLGQTIQMLANIGVVAGIVFLAFELQQNNELLAAEARVNQLEARRGTALQLTTNPQLTGILYRLEHGEAVTPEERTKSHGSRGICLRDGSGNSKSTREASSLKTACQWTPGQVGFAPFPQ